VLAVLAYHKIADPPRGAWEPWFYVPPGLLAEQLAGLQGDGWQFVDLDAVLRGLSDPGTLPERGVLVTFDDAYRSVLEHGLAVLAEAGAPGVVFVPVDFVGGLAVFDAGLAEPLEPVCSWDELRELAAAGVAIQSHGRGHVRLPEVSATVLEDELAGSKRTLEERLGAEISSFAYPYGAGGDEAVSAALERCGYRAAFVHEGGTVSLPAAEPYRIARIPVGPDTDLAEALAS
jgi:peptidoglycan/xylan/chitin deacetylase (PgdA/CDA1 family)